MNIEAIKRLIEATAPICEWSYGDEMDAAFTDARQAITEAEKQEPVAFASHGIINWIAGRQFQREADLYTHPQPKRAWAGLTMADKQAFSDQDFGGNRLDAMDYAEKILREKNA